jgi:hypothetical protein
VFRFISQTSPNCKKGWVEFIFVVGLLEIKKIGGNLVWEFIIYEAWVNILDFYIKTWDDTCHLI